MSKTDIAATLSEKSQISEFVKFPPTKLQRKTGEEDRSSKGFDH